MSKIPATDTWVASQKGETFGDIIETRNIDLNSAGLLKLARKAMALFSYGTASDALIGEDPAFQGTTLGIITDTEYAYVVTPAGTFRAHLTDSYVPVLQAPASNSPTHGFDSDIVWFQGLPHVSGGQYVSSLNLGFSTWAARVISGLSTTVPHPLCEVEHLASLAVGNGNTVKLYSAGYANTATLTLPSQYVVTTMRWRQNNIYVGTRHIYGGEAKMFIWDGSTASARGGGWGCGADWIYSLCEHDGVMTATVSTGHVRGFNGGGFTTIAAFPVAYTPFSWASTNPSSYTVGKVANRGTASAGDRLFINIDGSLNQGAGVYPGQYLPNQPSGLWELKTGSGLVHKASPNFKSRLRLPVAGVNSSFITTTAHQAATGDPIYVVPVGITGLMVGQVYYAIVASTTTMQLALSPADAYAGRYVVCSGTPSTDYIVVDRYEALGSDFVSYPGAVFAFGLAVPSAFFATEVLFGAGIYDSTLALYRATLCSLGMGRNRGHFVTSKISIEASSTQAPVKNTQFEAFAAFVESLNLDTDQIVLKYRANRKFGLPSPLAFSGVGATWTSTTTFTVDSTLKDVKSIAVGEEITVIKGEAAGYTCHVTAIENSTSLYTFTVDETMPVSTGTFDFIADNWTKWPVAFTRSSLADLRTGFKTTLDMLSGKWAEFKIELRGREVAIEEMQTVNTPKQ